MYGKSFHFIRKSKNLTQDYVCDNFLSRTSLSKFENEKNLVNFTTITHLLNRIDMSFDEFLYISNNFKNQDKQLILSKYFAITDNSSTDLIKEIIELGNGYLKSTYDQLISDVVLILECLLDLDQNSNISVIKETKKEVLDVWKRLSNMDQWYLIELKLVNSILFSLPLESSHYIGLRMLKELDKYNDFYYSFDLILSIYANLSTLFLHSNNIEECLNLSEKLVVLAKAKKRYDFLALGFVRKGICESNDYFIEKGMRILEIIDDIKLKEYISAELEELCDH